ncbi:hypothetical protein LSH36_37g03002 [Paralvinella palmiformis]|uniref:Uncharacterized protein n=1 Tax=Paralvinella palmiformis TaxID=53620 RepID=A0AAD9NE35_9ANNE|nr:hypothetical protein LSH36_37g03002 [Paralvinella palmiformis]
MPFGRREAGFSKQPDAGLLFTVAGPPRPFDTDWAGLAGQVSRLINIRLHGWSWAGSWSVTVSVRSTSGGKTLTRPAKSTQRYMCPYKVYIIHCKFIRFHFLHTYTHTTTTTKQLSTYCH